MAIFSVDSGTRVKTLPELKSRSFRDIRARMAGSSARRTA